MNFTVFHFLDNLLESPNPTESDAEVIERQVIVKEERRRKKNRTKRRNSDQPRYPDTITIDNGTSKYYTHSYRKQSSIKNINKHCFSSVEYSNTYHMVNSTFSIKQPEQQQPDVAKY